jgi:ATP synthase F1 complex assembly factor 2
VAAAVAAARVEEDFQMEEWGSVEAGHDLDVADARTRVTAAATFVRLLQGQ